MLRAASSAALGGATGADEGRHRMAGQARREGAAHRAREERAEATATRVCRWFKTREDHRASGLHRAADANGTRAHGARSTQARVGARVSGASAAADGAAARAGQGGAAAAEGEGISQVGAAPVGHLYPRGDGRGDLDVLPSLSPGHLHDAGRRDDHCRGVLARLQAGSARPLLR